MQGNLHNVGVDKIFKQIEVSLICQVARFIKVLLPKILALTFIFNPLVQIAPVSAIMSVDDTIKKDCIN